MKKVFKIFSLGLTLVTSLSLSLSAQVFTPPTGTEDVFPGGTFKEPTTTSCYSKTNVGTGFGAADLYISGFSGAYNSFVWRIAPVGAPANIVFAQGTFPYTNV